MSPPSRSSHSVLMLTLAAAWLVITSASLVAQSPDAVTEARDKEAAKPHLLQMVRDDAVHRELRLSQNQIQSVEVAIAKVDPVWWPSRILPADEVAAIVRELTSNLRQDLGSILTADQRRRLVELERQASGTRMVVRNDVIDALQITPLQSTRLADAFARTDSDVAAIEKQVNEKTLDAEPAAAKLQKIQSAEREQITTILTKTQLGQIGGLVGKTFDFSTIKRSYPRAPEFVTDGSRWLGGNETTMASLRGKVVVVYFYAFQCINCRRNFPHYKAWHDDLAAQGVTVIGIQTPETSAERDFNRVASAAQQDGFDYPVLFDEASGNWRAWGNTMWPTTYLIDKKGYIRRWWPGEMNWQGYPGEQDMRGTIQTLLAEKD